MAQRVYISVGVISALTFLKPVCLYKTTIINITEQCRHRNPSIQREQPSWTFWTVTAPSSMNAASVEIEQPPYVLMDVQKFKQLIHVVRQSAAWYLKIQRNRIWFSTTLAFNLQRIESHFLHIFSSDFDLRLVATKRFVFVFSKTNYKLYLFPTRF